MLKLYGVLPIQGLAKPLVARIAVLDGTHGAAEPWTTIAVAAHDGVSVDGEAIAFGRRRAPGGAGIRGILGPELDYLGDGDVIRLAPDGHFRVLFRASSRHNHLLVTERCNNACVMCSQPPRDAPDPHLLADALAAVDLMPPGTTTLGITGGEPTLLGSGLFALTERIAGRLPRVALQILSNGRMFRYPAWAEGLAAAVPADTVIGIPLYSDVAHRHDAVVQAAGAFNDTVRGIVHLAAAGIAVEIRIVLHRATIPRLVETARFIARNLPMAHHVSLMGLEITGYTRLHRDALWIDPLDYRDELARAVDTLRSGGMPVRVYGLQRCVVAPEIWPVVVPAISDWKNEYLPACAACTQRDHCGGFFTSQLDRPSRGIRAI